MKSTNSKAFKSCIIAHNSIPFGVVVWRVMSLHELLFTGIRSTKPLWAAVIYSLGWVNGWSLKCACEQCSCDSSTFTIFASSITLSFLSSSSGFFTKRAGVTFEFLLSENFLTYHHRTSWHHWPEVDKFLKQRKRFSTESPSFETKTLVQ